MPPFIMLMSMPGAPKPLFIWNMLFIIEGSIPGMPRRCVSLVNCKARDRGKKLTHQGKVKPVGSHAILHGHHHLHLVHLVEIATGEGHVRKLSVHAIESKPSGKAWLLLSVIGSVIFALVYFYESCLSVPGGFCRFTIRFDLRFLTTEIFGGGLIFGSYVLPEGSVLDCTARCDSKDAPLPQQLAVLPCSPLPHQEQHLDQLDHLK